MTMEKWNKLARESHIRVLEQRGIEPTENNIKALIDEINEMTERQEQETRKTREENRQENSDKVWERITARKERTWKYESHIQDENNILSKNLKEIDELMKGFDVNCNEFVRLCEIYEYLTIKKHEDRWLTLYAIYKLGEINGQRKIED